MQEEVLEQQQEELLAKLQHWQALKTAAGTFATEEIVNLLAHAIMGNPSGMIEGALFGGIAAIAAGYQAPKVLRSLRESLPHTEELEPFWLLTHREPGKRSLMDKLLDRQPPAEDHVQEAVVERAPRAAEEWEEEWYDEDEEDEEEDVVLPSTAGSRFTFSQVLASGFLPSLHRIYLGRLTDGSAVYVEAKDLCHVALAGNTGGGKSSLMRLIMAQLCSVGVRVLLLNPHYMRYDRAANEDWTPFDPYLNKPAIDCARYVNIKLYLQWMVETLLPRRIARARDGQPIGKPFFAVIDELPAIVAEIKEAPSYIAKLLREGRKYGIFLVVASQDFLVKTTGMDGGGVRKCFRTALYVGGDPTTANVLLGETQGKIPENDLGKGTIMLRCAATRQPVLANVPYVDNESLYTLLGPSTFVAGAPVEEEEVVTSYQERGSTDEVMEPPRNVTALPTPVIQDKGPRAEDIDLAAAIALWNSGYNSERKLMKAFRMTQHQAGRLIERIKEQAKEDGAVSE